MNDNDQCKHCTVRGNIKECQSLECSRHDSWYAMELKQQLKKAEASYEELNKKYYELIYHVESKHPNESRHETALRYIRNAEHSEDQCGDAQLTQESV